MQAKVEPEEFHIGIKKINRANTAVILKLCVVRLNRTNVLIKFYLKNKN